MRKDFYTRMAIASAMLVVVSAGAATVPQPSGRELKTERGFEMFGRKGQDPAKGRKAPVKIQDFSNDTHARVMAKSESEPTVLVDEDFSLWTEGSEAEPVYTAEIKDFWVDPEGMWDIAPTRTKQAGWAGQALHCAGGVCGLVYPDYGGFIQTPRMDYSGTVTLTARMKVSDQAYCKNAMVTIGLLSGDWQNGTLLSGDSYGSPKVPNDGEWHDVSFTYDNAYGGSDCYFQINSYDEIFVDDVKVTVVSDFLPHPEAKAATDFTRDGFKANWGEVAKASDYLLTCWRNVPTSDKETVYEEGFESLNHKDNIIDKENPGFPEGWEIDANGADLMVSEGDEVLGGKNALVLTADGQSIATPYTGSLITECTVNVRYLSDMIQITDPETGELYAEYIPGKFEVEGWDGHKWVYTGYSYMFSQNQEFKTWNLTDKVGGIYYRVRLVAKDIYNPEALVRVAFDDFKVVTLPASEREYVVKDEPVAATSYVFKGLDPASDYYYNVQARNVEQDIYSGEPEVDVFAFGLPAPEVYDATEIDRRGGYTANWEDAPKAEEYSIDNLRVYTAPQDVEDYTVIDESFAKLADIGVTTDAPIMFNNPYLMSLDEYCDNVGWVGYLCGIVDGAIGGVGIQEYQIGGQIQTPYLSLGNNGGKYKVSISACGTTGDYLYVVNSNGVGGAIPLTEQFEEYTAEFEGGSDFDFLAFYTAYKTPFYINHLKVVQNLEKGDKVLSTVETVQLEENSFRFSNLEFPSEDYSYAYNVYGIHKFLANTVWSPRSEVKFVTFPSGVGSVELQGAKVMPLDGAIEVTAADDAAVEIYSVAGMKVASFQGSDTVKVPAGVYMVNVNGKTAKVLVK